MTILIPDGMGFVAIDVRSDCWALLKRSSEGVYGNAHPPDPEV